MNLEEIKKKLGSLQIKYQAKIAKDFKDQKGKLDFFSNPRFSRDILMTNEGNYAEIIFTTNGENQESDGYSTPTLVKINREKRIRDYKATGEYITMIRVNSNDFSTIDSNEAVDALIDERLYLIEQREASAKGESLTFLLKQNNLNDTLAYLNESKKHFSKETPHGYSDCKNNCRKALESALAELEYKKFAEIPWIRDTEEVIFRKIKDLNAKQGSHPPTPERCSAVLALSLTEATLRFILEKRNVAIPN